MCGEQPFNHLLRDATVHLRKLDLLNVSLLNLNNSYTGFTVRSAFRVRLAFRVVFLGFKVVISGLRCNGLGLI